MSAAQNLKTPAAPAAIETLCPQCGLCCNGVLFADVELQKNDDPARLTQLNLLIQKKSRHKLAFAQPCACFNGQLCAIYPDRPQRCRAFECGLLQRVNNGQLQPAAALKTIARTKLQVNQLLQQIRQLGHTDETIPLTHRYIQLMQQPIDLAHGNRASKTRGQLLLAMNQLIETLQAEFLNNSQ